MYLISDETNGIGGCAAARDRGAYETQEKEREREGKEKVRERKRRRKRGIEKEEKHEETEKRKGKKAGVEKLAQSFSAASNTPPQQFSSASVIRVYRILYLNL